MDLKKARYILPNLFTLASVFFGFYAILTAVRAERAEELGWAAWMIAGSMVLDGLDGRVARATNSQSAFGVQLDSLADAIAFGVAPAFLAYRWGLEPLGLGGVFVAFLFVACGIMRLARFNVAAAQEDGPSAFFTGLPIPLAAGALVSLILAHTTTTGELHTHASWSVALIMVVLSGLMVSTLRYRTFKKLKSKRTAAIAGTLVLTALAITSLRFNPGVALTAGMAAYIVFGLVESCIGLGRDLASRRSAPKLDDDVVDQER